MTCRSARCSATRWRRSRAGRARSISRSRPPPCSRWPRSRCCWPMTGASRIIYVGVAAGVFVLLRLVAALLMFAARHAPRARSTVLRMAVANIHRPGALTPTIVLSLGLGIALLVTVIEIDGNLRQQFAAELPAKAPSFYFLDIPADEAAALRRLRARAGAAAKLEDVPMLRGRIVSANGIAGRKHQAERGRRLGAAKRPRHHLCRRDPGRLAAGRGQMVGAGLRRAAAGLVREEDRRRPRPQDRRSGHRQRARPQHHRPHRQYAHGRLAEPRHQFRHGVFAARLRRRAAYPSRHPDVSDGGTPAQEGAIVRAVADAFPWSPRCGSRTRSTRSAPSSPTWCWRSAAPARSRCWRRRWCWAARSPPATATGSTTRSSSRRSAPRGARLIAAYAIEYLLLGTATALFGVLSGSLAGWLIVTELMHLRFAWLPLPALAAAPARWRSRWRWG